MRIRLLSKDDLPVRVEWMNNPLVYKTMHFIPPILLDKTIEWYNRNQQNQTRCDIVFEDDKGNILAMGGLTNIDYSVRKSEFYIFVNPGRQRQGIGSLATYLLCKYGFDVLNLHKIYLYTNATNIGARRTYEKIGFTLEGVHRDEKVSNEMYEDRLYYGLLACELKDLYPLEFGGNLDIVVG